MLLEKDQIRQQVLEENIPSIFLENYKNISF